MRKVKELRKLVPLFEEKYNENYFKELEVSRLNFINDFSKNKIKNMTLKEYAIGKQNKNSFCYRIEIELKQLGGIQGSPAVKFGIYYSEKNQEYRYTKRYEEDGFESLKDDILSLIQFGEDKDFDSIKQSPISPMFKGKILAIYFPDDFQFILSEDHLDEFLNWFGYDISNFSSLLDKQIFIGSLKEDDEIISKFNNLKYMHFLEYALHNDSKYDENELSDNDEFKSQEFILEEKAFNKVINKIEEVGHEVTITVKDMPRVPNRKITINSNEHFTRNSQVIENALFFSSFQCEMNSRHKTFKSKRTGKNFVEVHHLVPMSEQDNFEYSLDIESNLVTLCPNCHRQVHLGMDEEKYFILEKLFNMRKTRLEKCNINVSLSTLKEMYK
ncbi:HNH endonuclease [Vagococcus fluvialis]|uniref:HNH endonuclease n=1 Tax=Vagococcus fluvialis TaxID=2738 RepID=UPI003B5AA853